MTCQHPNTHETLNGLICEDCGLELELQEDGTEKLVNCNHEDGQIIFGTIVMKDATQRVLLMEHDQCGAKGATYEVWDEDQLDYVFASEAWHKE